MSPQNIVQTFVTINANDVTNLTSIKCRRTNPSCKTQSLCFATGRVQANQDTAVPATVKPPLVDPPCIPGPPLGRFEPIFPQRRQAGYNASAHIYRPKSQRKFVSEITLSLFPGR